MSSCVKHLYVSTEVYKLILTTGNLIKDSDLHSIYQTLKAGIHVISDQIQNKFSRTLHNIPKRHIFETKKFCTGYM